MAVNEVEREIVIGEVKRHHERINLDGLKEKATGIIAKKKGWKVKYVALSIEDMEG